MLCELSLQRDSRERERGGGEETEKNIKKKKVLHSGDMQEQIQMEREGINERDGDRVPGKPKKRFLGKIWSSIAKEARETKKKKKKIQLGSLTDRLRFS